jgi:hypothetical protein
MRRDSTKHGSRLDGQLEKETAPLVHGAPTEARAEEYREQEGAGDGEREPSSRTAAPGALGLRPSAFPADREGLLAEADANDAPEPVRDALRRLPADRDYGTAYDVWEALGGEVEHVLGRRERR